MADHSARLALREKEDSREPMRLTRVYSDSVVTRALKHPSDPNGVTASGGRKKSKCTWLAPQVNANMSGKKAVSD